MKNVPFSAIVFSVLIKENAGEQEAQNGKGAAASNHVRDQVQYFTTPGVSVARCNTNYSSTDSSDVFFC